MKQNYQEIALNLIQPSKFNPRKQFKGPKMDELITSVLAQGVIEPVLVRPVDGKKVPFELVAGERRWRAALAAAAEDGGPDQYRIPALVRELSDDTAFDLMQNTVQDYLFEKLLKKRGRYKSCKKPKLISLFIESGADLAGAVPDEIIGEGE